MLKHWQICVFYLLIGSFAFPQNPDVNVSDVYVSISRNELSLREIFEEIEKQTSYLFVYSKEDLNPQRIIKINIRNKNLKNALDEILSPLGLTAEISRQYITIRKNNMPEKIPDTRESAVLTKIFDAGNVF